MALLVLQQSGRSRGQPTTDAAIFVHPGNQPSRQVEITSPSRDCDFIVYSMRHEGLQLANIPCVWVDVCSSHHVVDDCQTVLDILVRHYDVPQEEINPYPLMMSVLEVPNHHRFSFVSEMQIDQVHDERQVVCFRTWKSKFTNAKTVA